MTKSEKHRPPELLDSFLRFSESVIIYSQTISSVVGCAIVMGAAQALASWLWLGLEILGRSRAKTAAFRLSRALIRLRIRLPLTESSKSTFTGHQFRLIEQESTSKDNVNK